VKLHETGSWKALKQLGKR